MNDTESLKKVIPFYESDTPTFENLVKFMESKSEYSTMSFRECDIKILLARIHELQQYMEIDKYNVQTELVAKHKEEIKEKNKIILKLENNLAESVSILRENSEDSAGLEQRITKLTDELHTVKHQLEQFKTLSGITRANNNRLRERLAQYEPNILDLQTSVVVEPPRVVVSDCYFRQAGV